MRRVSAMEEDQVGVERRARYIAAGAGFGGCEGVSLGSVQRWRRKEGSRFEGTKKVMQRRWYKESGTEKVVQRR